MRCSLPFLVPLIACTSLLLSSCDEKSTSGDNSEKNADSGAGIETGPQDLPPAGFSVQPNMENALFTWVDKDGSFQISDTAEGVPSHARKTVRVVVDGHSPGGPEHVYVVDLSALEKGKKIPVRPLLRSEWEKLGQAKRNARVAELTPPEVEDAPSPADLGVDAIVYGAEWCKPCHLAEAYLKKKGARVIKKDIEEDPAAATEMRNKLKKAGMSGSSIPILDVGGTILKGFSERAVDAALRRQ